MLCYIMNRNKFIFLCNKSPQDLNGFHNALALDWSCLLVCLYFGEGKNTFLSPWTDQAIRTTTTTTTTIPTPKNISSWYSRTCTLNTAPKTLSSSLWSSHCLNIHIIFRCFISVLRFWHVTPFNVDFDLLWFLCLNFELVLDFSLV